MELPQALATELVACARRTAPAECCGLIGGRDDRATTIYWMRNRSRRRDRFRISTWDQLRTMVQIWLAGETLLAVVHSHPRGPAFPSRTDVRAARNPKLVHLIVSLSEQAMRAFRIRDGIVSQAPVLLT